ncbi:MAG: hypothetical protein P4L84_36495 [Isosphaeraceae bacterium]|nr:hypothetical protein [Isosphaeraceae bacterium]
MSHRNPPSEVRRARSARRQRLSLEPLESRVMLSRAEIATHIHAMASESLSNVRVTYSGANVAADPPIAASRSTAPAMTRASAIAAATPHPEAAGNTSGVVWVPPGQQSMISAALPGLSVTTVVTTEYVKGAAPVVTVQGAPLDLQFLATLNFGDGTPTIGAQLSWNTAITAQMTATTDGTPVQTETITRSDFVAQAPHSYARSGSY